jgi:FtsP/CotA-like multicopper oxidase with cupredoxin domain
MGTCSPGAGMALYAWLGILEIAFLSNLHRFVHILTLLTLATHSVVFAKQVRRAQAERGHDVCARPVQGSPVSEPTDLRSKNGLLKVTLTVSSSVDGNGHMRYCYIDEHGQQAPTLRVLPGDTLVINLKNEISLPQNANVSLHAAIGHRHSAKHDPCLGGEMTPAATNLHFHGLALPPVCHQDDTLKTLIQPGDPPFEYRVQISKNQAPGLYWYHPHVHGFTEDQILGGASGAIVVEGMEHAVPRVAGLPERVLVIRDERMPEPSDAEKLDPKRPTKQLSINYVPVLYPQYSPAILKMRPLERQFWRVLNASADTYLDLGVEFGGKRQELDMVAFDGVPVRYGEPGGETYAPQQTHVFLPPASRAEFIVAGPPTGMSGQLVTHYVYRGAADDDQFPAPRDKAQPALRVGLDDVDAARPLASIMTTDADLAPFIHPASIAPAPPMASLSSIRPKRKRSLYFSEKLVNPNDPNSATLFFITEEGHQPAVFDASNADATITVHQGDVEDWTIENRSRESHTFHVHQLHFIVVGARTARWEEPTLRDTIDVPAWDGFRRYPSVTVRMDFRDPRIIGTFPFHCHIMQHVDGGMMGTIRIQARSDSGSTR